MADNNSQSQGLHRINFHGKSGEYFSLWLTNVFLITITLGIYSAWATVRERRYFYTNTELDGKRFDYHAKPLQILIGRLLVISGIVVFYLLLKTAPKFGFVALLLLMALIPWGIVLGWRYNAAMSSYRGIRFNYICQIRRAYWVLMLCPVLLSAGVYIALAVLVGISSIFGDSVMSLTLVILLAPSFALINGIISTLQYELCVNNMYFGHRPFIAKLKKFSFIKFSLISGFISIVFLIFSLLFARTFFISLYHAVAAGNISDILLLVRGSVGTLFLSLLVLFFGFLIAGSYFTVASRNYLCNQTTLDMNIRFHSSVKTLPYMWLLLSNGFMVLFSLGFALPVAKVRLVRYLADRIAVEGDLSKLDIETHQMTANSAKVEIVTMA